MTNKLNFSMLEEEDVRRWPRRNPNEVVQMSLRMPAETYQRFRALCKQERRTNGDMLRVLMEGYFLREETKK